MKPDVLITGATGLIGGEIAWRLMAAGRRVWALIRSQAYADAAQRLDRRFALSGATCDWSRLVAVPGDVRRASLGLDRTAFEHLRKACGAIIHCAADTSFAVRNECAEVNLGGLKNVLAICQRLGPGVRLFHASSAAVCLGAGSRIVHEDDPMTGFANEYVRSKRAAEAEVGRSGLDATILRPSIVLSAGIPSRQFARSMLWVLPAMRCLGRAPLTGSERIDAVTVGFVAECVLRLLEPPLRHRVYHLSAGREGSFALRGLFAALLRDGHDYREVRFDPNGLNRPLRAADPHDRRLERLIGHYIPFLRADVVYDRSRLEAVLGSQLPPCPRLPEYCGGLLDLISEREALHAADRP